MAVLLAHRLAADGALCRFLHRYKKNSNVITPAGGIGLGDKGLGERGRGTLIFKYFY